ncbi:integrase domain-containing protein [Proteus alimentorum]|uniref:Integrase domain-containing protein n=1 Tax=Proteus alimentorum TaxID=1973495 RepID=A0ABS0IUY9_9GAMM|nr:integrase domain-containing protein [Proteus alimentorum]MBG2875752.1 integrase domain-containing protein [Proteus alimentorum]MBG2879182.1 integrase domain-containing protein [Proteus alimentorum]
MSKLSKQLTTLAKQGGGSFKTVADRLKIASRIADRMGKLNIQIRDVKHIKTNHIELYIKSRQEEGISKRTLQNEMAGIRNILAVAARTKLASPQHEKLSNHALGLSNASRNGTKVAISEERYLSAFYHAEKQDMGVAMTMQIARYFGLRTEEAIQSAKSLKTWQRALIQGEKSVRIVFGTKGGRPRDTTIIDREKMLYAVNQALNLASQSNGKLIDKPDLKSAIDRYRNVVRNAGLTGKYAPHSLRYAWAVDAMDYHKNNGMSDDEAKAMVSMDLGHGDGRGRYVERVYNKLDIND